MYAYEPSGFKLLFKISSKNVFALFNTIAITIEILTAIRATVKIIAPFISQFGMYTLTTRNMIKVV